MQGLSKILNILKLGATKETYPTFGSYLISDGETVRTWNGRIYVEMNYKAPFIGATNIYILENILKNITENARVNQSATTLFIEDQNVNAKLEIIENVDIPILEKPDVKTIEITDEILDDLSLANGFVGGAEHEAKYQYIFMGDSFICATDRSRVFIKSIPKIETSISLDKQMLNSLIIGARLGSDRKNVLIDYSTGFMLAQTHIVSDLPVEEIANYVNECSKGVKEICNMAVAQDAIKQISPIFYGEKDIDIKISTQGGEDQSVIFSAESTLNGYIDAEYETEMDEEFEILMNPSYFKNIPIDYNIFANPELESVKRFYLTNGDAEIVLLGKEVIV